MPLLPEDHVHEIERKYSPNHKVFWTCTHPDCTFFTYDRTQIEGKRVICAVCHTNDLILTKESLRRAKPRCLECSNTAEAQKVKQMREASVSLMDEILDNTLEPEDNLI